MQKAGKPSFKGVGACQVLLIFVQPIKTKLLEQLNLKKFFFKADITNFRGINGVLGADVFGQ